MDGVVDDDDRFFRNHFHRCVFRELCLCHSICVRVDSANQDTGLNLGYAEGHGE